jgi:hypothetical protein
MSMVYNKKAMFQETAVQMYGWLLFICKNRNFWVSAGGTLFEIAYKE